MVMVSDSVEELDLFGGILEIIIDAVQVLREVVLPGIPIKVPGHVTERDDIGLDIIIHYIRLDFFHAFVELIQIVRPVSQMHVAEEIHTIFFLINLYEVEIVTFRLVGFPGQCRMEPRKHAFGAHLITLWNRNEYIAPFLRGFKLIDAVLVRFHHFDAIRNDHVRQPFAVAMDHAVHVIAAGRLNVGPIEEYVNVYVADDFSPGIPADQHFVASCGDFRVQCKSETAFVYGLDLIVEAFRGIHQHDYVARLRSMTSYDLQCHVSAFFRAYGVIQYYTGDIDRSAVRIIRSLFGAVTAREYHHGQGG